MADLRRWLEANNDIPDDAIIHGTLPEFPRHWARGNSEYTNFLIHISASYNHSELGNISTSDGNL
jgi:hypothetical protein